MSLIFQTLYWDSYTNEEEDNEYCIQVFGRDKIGKSIYVEINNYKPFFFVLIPDKIMNNDIDEIIINLKKKIFYKYKQTNDNEYADMMTNYLLNYEILYLNDFSEYTTGKKRY